jgi:hypothetical protein
VPEHNWMAFAPRLESCFKLDAATSTLSGERHHIHTKSHGELKFKGEDPILSLEGAEEVSSRR